MEPECRVTLDNFSGPLDLLLHLIHKNRIEITDIPIALVTAQYLQYLELMQALDVVVAGEYLVMAATLLQIKSRMLLPSVQVEEEEDPREEIVRPLVELAALKEAALRLEERPLLGRDVFVPPSPPYLELSTGGNGEGEGGVVRFDVSLHDLVAALKTALGRQALPRRVEVEKARVTMGQRMAELRRELAGSPSLSLFELLGSGRRGGPDRALRRWIIVTFLAVLELARRREARLIQEEQGGDIRILRRA